MYKRAKYKILANEALTSTVFRMRLEGDTQYITRAGQFINIELDRRFLRRPISVCDYDVTTITIIYKVVGVGTRQMSEMSAGGVLDILTGLGNGFSTDNASQRPLLVGGGVGVPPLYNLAKRLLAQECRPTLVVGFNSADEVFYRDEFAALGVDVRVTTVDGSVGVKGFVTDAIEQVRGDYDYIYACGPIPMLRAVSDATDVDAQFSFEERMGCGFGACVGCTCKTKYGAKRICKDGPVLFKEEIIW